MTENVLAEPWFPDPPRPDPPARARRVGTGVVAAAGAVALVAGAAGGWFAGREASSDTPASSVDVAPVSLTLAGETLDVAGVVAAVEASVVSIETSVSYRQGPFVQEGTGAGTGVVLDADAGLILTNAHVVADATSVEVTVPGDDVARTATVEAVDEAADIAVLVVEDTDGLIAAPIGENTDVNVGDDVVAIGNALALEGGLTVTEGIVSAVDRSIETDSGTLMGLLQTDAAISSGNSGGPLVNALGQVIGINTAVAASSGSVSASNIGFAIDIDTALAVVEQLLGTSAV